jgi:hypothetical protein
VTKDSVQHADQLTNPSSGASAPAGDWQLDLEDTPVVRNLFTDGVVQDLVVVFALFIGDQRAAGSSNTLE